jgi:hypothetical protein
MNDSMVQSKTHSSFSDDISPIALAEVKLGSPKMEEIEIRQSVDFSGIENKDERKSLALDLLTQALSMAPPF